MSIRTLLHAFSLGLLVLCMLSSLGWLPFTLTLLAFGGLNAYLLALSALAMIALPATMLAWVIRGTKRMPRITHIAVVDLLYFFVIAYHGAVGWLTPASTPITPWLIGYHCLALFSLAVTTTLFLYKKNADK
jgi:hypothetical protein